MKRIFTIIVLALWCLLAGQALAGATDGYVPFIEQGKTWWYYTFVEERLTGVPGIGTHDFYFGVTMQGTVEYDGYEWTACHFVNTEGEIVSTRPVALLREEDRKVFVTADHLKDSWEGLVWMEKDGVDFAPKPYFYDLISLYCNFSHAYDEFHSLGVPGRNDGYNEYPALLYDFNWNTGDTFAWPWYGRFDSSRKENGEWENIVKPLQVGDTSTLQSAGYELSVCTIGEKDEFGLSGEESLPDYSGRIIEGVGCAGMGYIDGTNHGDVSRKMGSIFFSPCQYLGQPISGYYPREYSRPELLGVELPDGSLLYGDASRPWSGVETVKEATPVTDNAMYDLMGRRVDHPVKGTVYIQNGRKTVYNTNH